jgi:HAD superfamily hydrolase (TIGR01509 family)
MTKSGGGGQRPAAAILDVDGTLVDTNYQHALAWYRALRQHGITVPLWEIHRHIGMGGDQLVQSLVGEGFDERHGDDVRAAEKALYLALMPEVQPLPGARGLLEALNARGHTIVLSSSAKPDELQHYVQLLDAHEIIDGWTDSGDVEKTKPEPDLIKTAIEKAGGTPAVMIGDSVWDCQAATRAKVPTIGVLSGGFSREELETAGAKVVFESIDELRRDLDSTPIG